MLYSNDIEVEVIELQEDISDIPLGTCLVERMSVDEIKETYHNNE